MPQELAIKDACELLDADHIAVKHLFVRYACLAFSGDRAGERQMLARRICSELTVHAQIEEEIFYPALRDTADASEILDEAHAEHLQAKQLIAELEALTRANSQMDELIATLARAVEHHVKEERDLLFPKARAAAKMDLTELGAQMHARQQELQGQMS